MPAILKINRQIVNDVWSITFTLDIAKLPESDKQAMQKFGEPEINAGGVFLADTANEYTLPDKYIRIRTDLPFTQAFDAKSAPFDTNTQIKAEAYQAAFVAAYSAAFTNLREEAADTFTGEAIENI